MVSPTTTSLDGTWLFRPDPTRRGELYPEQLHYSHAPDARWSEPGSDRSRWQTITVPGLWTRQGHAELECGWYRLDFANPGKGGLATLVFEGVDYFADVWLNGEYLGSHEGYLGRFSFDIADLLQSENVLVVRVDSPWDVPGHEHEIGQMKTMFRGALERWDMNDPDSKPAGIWASVRIDHAGTIRIANASVTAQPQALPPQGDPDTPVQLSGQIAVTANGLGNGIIRYTISPIGFEGTSVCGEVPVTLTGSERATVLDFHIPDARLWWTWDLGTPNRYEIIIELVCNRVLSDRHVITTGFRQIDIGAGWSLRLNGLPFYQRGANYLSDIDLSTMTRARYDADAALFKAANLNTVHPFAVVEAESFYDACDATGLLVYQDFPIWMMSSPDSGTVRAALRQFDDMLVRLGQHPSIAIWNMGSQPSVANFEKLCSALVRHARQKDPTRIAHHGNSAISYETGTDIHPSRSFFWSEASAERFEARYGWRRDCHMYPGWYFGGPEAIAEVPPSHFALVTEFGAQALPGRDMLERFIPKGTKDIPWNALAARCAQPALLKRHCRDAKTLDDLIDHSQRYQATVVRHDIEFIRSQKSPANHGLHVFAFADCWPAVTWSLLDYDRNPKRAYHALVRAMEPVQVFLSDYLSVLEHGAGQLELTIVNDLAKAIANARLTVEIDGMEHTIEHVEVPPFGRSRLTTFLKGTRRPSNVVLSLSWGKQEVRNAYGQGSDAA